MKKRLGYVSNSSSSSFLIGCGKIKDKEAFEEFLVDKNIKDMVHIISTDEIKAGSDRYFHYNPKNSEFEIESFMGNIVSCKIDSSKKENYFFFEECPGDDSDFSIYNENGEWEGYNYDIDASFFENCEAGRLFDLYDCSNIEDLDVAYGAGRNG